MSQSGQQWKKPTDIMRTRRQKKRQSIDVSDQKQADNLASDTDCRSWRDSNCRKRKNPFDVGSSATRRATGSDKRASAVQNEKTNKSADIETNQKENNLFSILNEAEKKLQQAAKGQSKSVLTHGELCQTRTLVNSSDAGLSGSEDKSANDINLISTPTSELIEEQDQKTEVPVDWSLKVKLRIVSQVPLFSGPLSTAAKVMALTRYVHNAPLPAVEADNKKSMLRCLQQCCHYWVHPCLPGFPDFPRITPHATLKKQVWLEVGGNKELKSALYNNWLVSFESVYHELKAGVCPYFYLCCHHFTALFCAAGVGEYECVTACLTPTTRGLREALHREDVEYTMPNQAVRRRSDKKSAPTKTSSAKLEDSSSKTADENDGEEENDDDESDIITTDEGASRWLEEVGLDKRKFPNLQPSKVKIEREGYQQVDGRPESLVMCVGGAVQALYNFLLNCRSCSALTGPQAGIPPTLLSPTPFTGATLKNHRMQQSMAKLSSGTSTDSSHVVEITGPVLPHHVLNITALLQQCPHNTSVLSLNTHEPTVPFNLPTTHSTLLTAGGKRDSVSQNTSLSSSMSSSSLNASLQNYSPSPTLDTSQSSKHSFSHSPSPGHLSASTESPRCEIRSSSSDLLTPASGSQGVSVYSLGVGGQRSVEPALDSDCWDNGLHPSVRRRLCGPSTLKAGTALREIHCQHASLSWTD